MISIFVLNKSINLPLKTDVRLIRITTKFPRVERNPRWNHS